MTTTSRPPGPPPPEGPSTNPAPETSTPGTSTTGPFRMGAPPGRYSRAEFDACYWLLADLCEQTVDMPLAQAWPIMDAFNQIAEIGTPRFLYLAQPGPGPGPGADARGPVADADAGDPAAGWLDPTVLAADVAHRVAALTVRAGSLPEALAWGRIGDLLTVAFPNLPTPYPGGAGSSA
jgi:hypothetical protein